MRKNPMQRNGDPWQHGNISMSFHLHKWMLSQLCLFSVDGCNCAPDLFGDSFGTVNTLVSALAFACMIVTFD